MPITVIVEDGSVVDGANSYVSLDEMGTYATQSPYGTAWSGATDDQKAQALIMATLLMDQGFEYFGEKSVLDSSLDWPRAYVRNPGYRGYSNFGSYRTANEALAGRGSDLYFADNLIPKKFKQLVMQQTLELLAKDRVSDADQKGISSLSVGSGAVAVVFNPGDVPKLVTEYIQASMAPFGTFRSASSGSVGVIRG